MCGLALGGIATLRRRMSAWVVPVKFWKPGIRPGRDAGVQDRQEVGPIGVERRQVGEHAGVEHREQRRQLGAGDVLAELGVVARSRPVPPVLQPDRDEHLVDQRVAEPRDLGERTRAGRRVLVA